MSERLSPVVERGPWRAFNARSGSIVRRKCACGEHSVAGGECDACRKRRVRGALRGPSAGSEAPPTMVRRAHDGPIGPRRQQDFSGLPTRTASHAASDGVGSGAWAPPARSEGSTLEVGDPDDPLEREAERIARQITAQPPAIRRYSVSPPGGARAIPSALPRSGGRPLSPGTRAFMEPRLGADLSHVRVHSGLAAERAADRLDARAFTYGHAIWLGRGATESDSRLMAHELVHVMQQTVGRPGRPPAGPEGRAAGAAALFPVTPAAAPAIQRDLSCHIRHVEEECDQAEASCLTVQSTHCASTYPEPEDIENLHANAVKGATAKGQRLPNASRNLLHFLGATGSELVMPTSVFRDHNATKRKLGSEHRPRFIEGVRRRLADGRLAAGGSVEMQWTGTANAFAFKKEDLGLAVGGYTLCSNVKVSTADKGGGSVEMTFDSWRIQAFDCYNWDPGKGIGGLFGGITDNDLCCLQNAGKGKHFRIRTDPWDNTHTSSMDKATVSGPASSSTPAPSPGHESPPESEGR